MGDDKASPAAPVAPKRKRPPSSSLRGYQRPPLRRPEPWEHQLLVLISEQTAMGFDQLTRFIDCDPEQGARVARHLTKVGYADYGRILADEPQWIWLTEQGRRFAGTGFEARGAPKLGAMARMRAVNEVRLHIARRAPQARWICGRSVVREQGSKGRRPNAVVEIGDERHAIVVKAGMPHLQEREREIVETLMGRYDAMIFFGSSRPRAMLERLKSEHHWPQLVVRPIPQALAVAARPARGH